MVQISAPQLLPVRRYGCGKKSHRNHGLCIVHSFRPESENLDSNKKMVPTERASQEEQNFSSVAPPSEELCVWKDTETMDYDFWPETELLGFRGK